MKRTLCIFSLAMLCAFNAFGHVNGPDPAVNGIFTQTCNQSGCHESYPVNLASSGGSVTVTGLPATWTANQPYPLTVTIKGPAAQRLFGYQLSAVSDATNAQAGTFTAGTGSMVICGNSSGQQVACSTAGSIQFAEHSNANIVRSSYSVTWKAPSGASAGTIRFNVAGNAANGDLQPTGDYIYTNVYKVAPAVAVDLTTHAFTMVDRGGVSVITDGNGGTSWGYARVLTDTGSTPSGVAIFGERIGGILVTEAGVPASPKLTNGRIYAEVGTGGANGFGTDIGLAIANPGTQPAMISFKFTDTTGNDIASGTTTLDPGVQYPAFLDQAPWNCPLGFQGTFSFSSNVGISVIALQGFRNQRNEFLITTLPVIDTTVPPSPTPAVLSQFTDGAGWSTSVLLVNPTDTPMSGTIQFRLPDGTVASLSANGATGKSFNYSVPRRSSFKLQTAGQGSLQSGTVIVTPAAGNNTPVSLAVFSFAASNTTITQAGVPSILGTQFRAYVEATAGLGAPGTYSTGGAVSDASGAGGTVTFELYTKSGAFTGLTQTLLLPAFGQVSKFIGDIFPNLTLPFQGIMRVTTTSPSISVVALRIRYNERPNEFIMTTTPPADEFVPTSNAEVDFPHILNGGGYTTQFILFSGAQLQTATGNLKFDNHDGAGLSLNVQ